MSQSANPQSDVHVRLDDRLRLMSAVLSATNWPDKSQERKPHGTHAHARATRKFLMAQKDHPAVAGMQMLIDQNAPLEAMFTLVLHFSWPELAAPVLPKWAPPRWNEQLRDFYEKSNLEQWWKNEDEAWKKSFTESEKMFRTVQLKPFLEPFLGKINETFVFVPNISYPSDQEIGLRVGSELLVVTPPRLAWGDSPPWPFDEDPSHVYRAAMMQICKLLLIAYLRQNAEQVAEATKLELPVSEQFRAMNPTWEEQFIELFSAAAVAIYLEDYINAKEAKAYVLMEHKARGMTILPGTISVMRRYLQERGHKYNSLVEFLPLFPKQLRVAKRIVSL